MEFCNTELKEESESGKPFDMMTPINVVLLSMYLDATLGIEWNQKAAYAQFFNEYVAKDSKQRESTLNFHVIDVFFCDESLRLGQLGW